MNEYNNGKIYKIINNIDDIVYIGSTTQTLKRRYSSHKCSYLSYMRGIHKYYTAFSIFDKGINNCKIELIENFPCDNRAELEYREKYYIKQFNCINKNIPGRTKKEYNDDNKEHIKEHTKKYREDNKEHIKKYREDNYEKIKEITYCECGGKYRYGHKNEHNKTNKHLKYLNNQQPNQVIDVNNKDKIKKQYQDNKKPLYININVNININK